MTEQTLHTCTLLGYNLLKPYPGIVHFVTTRSGGCSKGNYDSLNLTSYTGDDPSHVAENRRRLCHALDIKENRLILPYQTHSTNLLNIDAVFLALSEEEQHTKLQGIDGVITALPGICVCVSTADCIPILMYDREHDIVAAVHAGWRGTVQKIAVLALQKMGTLFGTRPEELIVGFGPGISQEAFEVGPEVFDTFKTAGFPMAHITQWHAGAGKYHIDLWEANRWQLLQAGIPDSQMECAGLCSWKHEEKLFSARRLGIKSGRTLSGIMIRKD
ncbi:MAG TPA: peptidoglycan editing factor PgeF [Bacteroidales bacterium]